MNVERIISQLERRVKILESYASRAKEKGSSSECIAWNHSIISFREAIVIIKEEAKQ